MQFIKRILWYYCDEIGKTIDAFLSDFDDAKPCDPLVKTTLTNLRTQCELIKTPTDSLPNIANMQAILYKNSLPDNIGLRFKLRVNAAQATVVNNIAIIISEMQVILQTIFDDQTENGAVRTKIANALECSRQVIRTAGTEDIDTLRFYLRTMRRDLTDAISAHKNYSNNQNQTQTESWWQVVDNYTNSLTLLAQTITRTS